MGLSTRDLVGRLETRTVAIKGRAVKVRELAEAERFKIRQVFPEPAPPLETPANDPRATPTPNYHNPGYRDRLRNWSRRVLLITVALAVGWITDEGVECPGVQAPGFLPWAERASEELPLQVTEEELAALFAAACGEGALDSGLPAPEEARKN